MQGILFDHIQSLDKSRTNWRMKVRCTRTWSTLAMDTNVLRGYNFIFLDDDNSHVHAYVYPDNWTAIGKEVVEGKVYVVENFQVRSSTGRLKPVANKLCIRLLSSTKIEEQPDDIMIPTHKFELVDLSDLVEESNKIVNAENPEFALDIIGIIEDFNYVNKIPTKIGDREVVRFTITDRCVYYQVTVWGALAILVNADYIAARDDPPVVGIISSSKISTFNGKIQVGTLPSTKVYFNLDIEPVAEMRIHLKEEGYKPRVGSSNNSTTTAVPLIEHVSFSTLIGSPEVLSSMKHILSTFTITKIEEEDNWWYFSCSICHDEVTKVERKFKCEKCQRSFPYSEKRFRILVLADDKTHACNVILMDRVVKRILGTTATNILNELKKTPSSDVVTKMYKSLIGKEVSTKISLSEANISGDSNIYEVVDLFDPSMQQRGIVAKTPESSSSVFTPFGVVHGIELFQTPESSSSVSKKIKKEDGIIDVN